MVVDKAKQPMDFLGDVGPVCMHVKLDELLKFNSTQFNFLLTYFWTLLSIELNSFFFLP